MIPTLANLRALLWGWGGQEHLSGRLPRGDVTHLLLTQPPLLPQPTGTQPKLKPRELERQQLPLSPQPSTVKS